MKRTFTEEEMEKIRKTVDILIGISDEIDDTELDEETYEMLRTLDGFCNDYEEYEHYKQREDNAENDANTDSEVHELFGTYPEH